MASAASPELSFPHVWRGRELAQAQESTVSTGHAVLDAHLPGRGWPLGSLVEVLLHEAQQHVWQLLGPGLAAAMQQGDPAVLVDRVRDGSFSYRAPDGTDRPGDWRTAWDDTRAMPRIVRIALQLDGTTQWPELDAPLRVDVTAVQGQAADLLQGLQRRNVQ